MPIPRSLVSLCAIAVTLFASAVRADVIWNENGGFDSSLQGWVLTAPVGGAIVWDSVDATGNPMSGTARLTGPAGVYSLRTCFVAPVSYWPFYYRVETRIRIQGAPSFVHDTIRVGFAGDAGEVDLCVGPHTHEAVYFGGAAVSAGPFELLAAGPQRASPGPLGSVWVTVMKEDAADVAIDDVYLYVTDQLFGDGF